MPNKMKKLTKKKNKRTISKICKDLNKKNPVMILNETPHGFRCKEIGTFSTPNKTVFGVAMTVADMTFEGWGHSKREARASAARVCLAALLARAGHVLPDQTRAKDFTVDDTTPYPVSEFQCLESKSKIEEQTKQNAVTETAQSQIERNLPTSSLFGATAPTPASKSPINVLYENHPGLLFICTYGDGTPLDSAQVPLQLAHSMRFKVVCQIKEQKFEGYGSSKKLAKLAAARSALAVLEEGRADIADSLLPSGYLSQTLADHIANLVNSKFSEMMKNDVIHSKRKVLAGIVMTTDSKVDGAKVIAVATGTKCVSGEHMSVRGRAVNDCHAEVAARRCLQRHLYTQLLLYASQKDPRKPIPEADIEPAEGGGYRLRPDRQLHMYVSTAPCGDGRIFSPHEQLQHEPDRHPNRLARGQLRTKIESGEGTIPVKNCNSLLQTWDGVMQGERLLTMSCSDKVARWCVLGLQGSLMSTLLAPVYPTSIVLGSLLHPHHLYRAICGRIEAYISSLPPPYHLRRPLLARAASTEARTPTRAPSFSVCWACTNTAPEVLNATTGKLENGQPSLLCKQSMFARWQYLIKKLPPLQQSHPDGTSVSLPNHLDTLLYNEAKLLSPTYQVAKDRLFQAFEKAKLGRWIKKPLEQDQFVCELLSADPAALFTWTDLVQSHSATRYDDRASGDDGQANDSVKTLGDDKRERIKAKSDVGVTGDLLDGPLMYEKLILAEKARELKLMGMILKAKDTSKFCIFNDKHCNDNDIKINDKIDGGKRSKGLPMKKNCQKFKKSIKNQRGSVFTKISKNRDSKLKISNESTNNINVANNDRQDNNNKNCRANLKLKVNLGKSKYDRWKGLLIKSNKKVLKKAKISNKENTYKNTKSDAALKNENKNSINKSLNTKANLQNCSIEKDNFNSEPKCENKLIQKFSDSENNSIISHPNVRNEGLTNKKENKLLIKVNTEIVIDKISNDSHENKCDVLNKIFDEGIKRPDGDIEIFESNPKNKPNDDNKTNNDVKNKNTTEINDSIIKNKQCNDKNNEIKVNNDQMKISKVKKKNKNKVCNDKSNDIKVNNDDPNVSKVEKNNQNKPCNDKSNDVEVNNDYPNVPKVQNKVCNDKNNDIKVNNDHPNVSKIKNKNKYKVCNNKNNDIKVNNDQPNVSKIKKKNKYKVCNNKNNDIKANNDHANVSKIVMKNKNKPCNDKNNVNQLNNDQPNVSTVKNKIKIETTPCIVQNNTNENSSTPDNKKHNNDNFINVNNRSENQSVLKNSFLQMKLSIYKNLNKN